MTSDSTVHRIRERLFAEPAAEVFALLDGASTPDLRKKMWQHEPDHYCLFRQVTGPDMAEVAPYVVRLERDSPFTQWVLKEGWGDHWGLFAVGRTDLRAMRQHCRTMIDAYDPAGRPVIFRFYDPRVLRVYLPTCTPAERAAAFGPIQWFFVEDADPAVALRYRSGPRGPHVERMSLSALEQAPVGTQ